MEKSVDSSPEKLPPPKVFAPDEISAIPPELLKELNIVPDHRIATPGNPVDEDLADIPPELLAKVRAIAGTAVFTEEPGGFSWAGLVYGPVYYFAMKDWLFMILSTIASVSVYAIPALIPLAFFARKRAWQKKTWEGEEQFWKVQHQWDKSAIVGGILSIIVLYFVGHYVLSTLYTAFGTTDPSAVLQQVQNVGQ